MLTPVGRWRSVTAVDTLLTFWPPGPLERANVSSRSTSRIARRCIRSVNMSFAMTSPAGSNRRDIFAPMPKDARHPDQLVQERIDAAHEILVQQLAPLVEHRSDFSKVHIFKNRHQTKLTHDWQKSFDYARSSESAR